MRLLFIDVHSKYPNFLNNLKSTQLSWIQYRDTHLNLLFPYENLDNVGSVIPMCYYIEKANLTWGRVIHLEKILV